MADDEAGPLIGWSLGTGLARRPIEELCDFPCTWAFKAVGVASEGFVRGLLLRVEAVIGRRVKDDEHKVRESEHGRYQSVTMNLFVTSGAQVYSIYAALHDDDGVKYVF